MEKIVRSQETKSNNLVSFAKKVIASMLAGAGGAMVGSPADVVLVLFIQEFQ
jgi:hypothetical protein